MNRQIRLSPVRVIDENGANLGDMDTTQALQLAQERGLDLVEVGPNARPPVCRIVDYGKWKYEQAKRARTERQTHKAVKSEVKGVRITFRASTHDLKRQADLAAEFLSEGHTVHIEMPLRGREKGKEWFARERMRTFLDMLTVPWRAQQEARRGGRGLEMMVVRDKTRANTNKRGGPSETSKVSESGE